MTNNEIDECIAESNAEPILLPTRPFRLIGELMNNSFARARRAWQGRDLAAYQRLAKHQSELGADYLTLNLDGTQHLRVKPQEMFDFLPDLIPALQESTSLPLSFDNPSVDFHRQCLKVYEQSRSGRPIVNSVAASRPQLEEMFELIAEYDTLVIVMASERFVNGASGQCLCAQDVHDSAKQFVELLHTKSARTNDQIIIDPGLAPVGADTYGLVNTGLDAMRLIREDRDLEGVHLSIGLTNFSFGVPKEIREGLERAYLSIAVDLGLDFVLGNPEKCLELLDDSDRYVQVIREALALGRPCDGESQEEAGYRQAQKIMDLF